LINISKIQLIDIPIIFKFIDSNFNDFKYFIDLGWTKKNIKNHFEKNNNYSLGCFKNKQLNGILLGETIFFENKLALEIHIFVIEKESRQKKIGTKILDFVKINKKITKISKIYLEVAENNLNALKFYEKNNFVFLKFRHNYYKINNENINAKCYLKEI
tara:strand:- start:126 stop:602 length:477 start_codon:yes stop_codon:yes gene_type:complete